MYANQREGPAFVIMPNNAFASQDQNLIHSFKKTPVLVLSSLQIVASAIAVLTQIVLVIYDDYYGIGYFGTGFWCGMFFVVSGSLGVHAAKKTNRCSITAFLVMSILSACMCLPLMFFASVGVADAQFSYNGYNPYQDVQMSINAIQIVVALVTAGFAITTSALSCRALCCANNINQGTTLYNGQQVSVTQPNYMIPATYGHQGPMLTMVQNGIPYSNGYAIGAPGQFYPSSNPPQYVQQTPALPESRVEPSSNDNQPPKY